MIVSEIDFIKLLKQHKKAGDYVVFTNGCFDLLHPAHAKVLMACAEIKPKMVGRRTIVAVGVNSNRTVQLLKGKNRPVLDQEDRAELVDSIKGVDYVTIFDMKAVTLLVKKIRPNCIVKGGDYKCHQIKGAEYADEIMSVGLCQEPSSTDIIRKIKGFK